MSPPCFRQLISCNVLFLLMSLFSYTVFSQSVVDYLPGFAGKLPFRLETGYIGVEESEQVQLFYYFVESEGNPENDPLFLWLTGGPGCSGFSGLVYEIGPIIFDYANSNGTIPTLILNPYSWTKVANIIFLDQPVGTGFSYAKTPEAYKGSDTLSGRLTYEFLNKWLTDHPKYLKNPLFIAGDSYSGLILPLVVNEVYNGIEAGSKPLLNMKGYILGNPVTDVDADNNGKVHYAHRMGLLSDKLYLSAKENCNGYYLSFDSGNDSCEHDLERVNQDMHYFYSNKWANIELVQKALNIREGTKTEWVRCNITLAAYTYDVSSTVDYHKNFTQKDCRILIYSGDHDMVIPHTRTEEWIESLKLPIQSDWRPWFVEDQIAGYSTVYLHDDYELTYATVKGAGHTAPEYKPKQCFRMIKRWLSPSPL